jgi:UDP-N-acetylglucosamine/UDP-N-acetylgalactosamine diphosphorylase
MAPTPVSYEATLARLQRVGQEHLLNFHASLSPAQQRSLLAQIAELDVESLPAVVEAYVKNKPAFSLPPNLGPAPYFARNASQGPRPWDRAGMEKAGEDLIRAGRIAAFVVAGGQGSRLGFEGPKGCYPAGAVTDKSLFELFSQHFVGAKRRYGVDVPWYIMTSPLNHQATVEFFEQHGFFGLDRRNVMFFPQGVLPSLDITSGKVLLTSPGEVATNPDGHGGSIKALAVSGALADMKRRGIEHLSYFQVDNPLVRPLDPAFIGLHAASPASSGEMSSKMIPKAYPEEKMGLFCSSNGKVDVIEYSDLPMDLQRERLPDGSLRFIAGSIAIHMIGVEFIDRVANDPSFALPYHRAEKKIPCIDPATGAAISPTSNNGVKLEKFVFDALANCRDSIVYETDRNEEFGPIKNATGVDSVETSKALQTARAAAWLEACGVQVPRKADGSPDCTLEISAAAATCAAELARTPHPTTIERGARCAI